MNNLSLIITYQCNLKCKHCLRGPSKNINLDINLFDDILGQLKDLHISRIQITGGEPCLHPDFNKIIEKIIRHQLSFTIATNGFKYKEYKFLLSYKEFFSSVGISVDGLKLNHEQMRGDRTYEKTLNAIEFFINNGIETHVTMLLTKNNYKEMNKVAEDFENRGVKKLIFGSIIPNNIDNSLVLDDEQRRIIFDDFLDIYNRFMHRKLTIGYTCSFFSLGGEKFCKGLEVCNPVINPLGELIFCCDTIKSGAIIGKVNKQNLGDLLKKKELINQSLTETRKLNLSKNTFIDGFDTCIFCNHYLENLIA